MSRATRPVPGLLSASGAKQLHDRAMVLRRGEAERGYAALQVEAPGAGIGPATAPPFLENLLRARVPVQVAVVDETPELHLTPRNFRRCPADVEAVPGDLRCRQVAAAPLVACPIKSATDAIMSACACDRLARGFEGNGSGGPADTASGAAPYAESTSALAGVVLLGSAAVGSDASVPGGALCTEAPKAQSGALSHPRWPPAAPRRPRRCRG